MGYLVTMGGGGEEEDIFDLAMEFGIFGYHGTVLGSIHLPDKICRDIF